MHSSDHPCCILWLILMSFSSFSPHQVAKTKQRIEEEKMQIQVVERTQQITLQDQEIVRKEKELEAKVKKPAEAEKYKLEKLAEAERWAPGLNIIDSYYTEESVHVYNLTGSVFCPAACSSSWRPRLRPSPSEWVLPPLSFSSSLAIYSPSLIISFIYFIPSPHQALLKPELVVLCGKINCNLCLFVCLFVCVDEGWGRGFCPGG